MQPVEPYLFTSPRTVALVDQAQMVPAEGPVADSVYGYHTFWAAEVPFIPAHISKNDHDFDTEATNRITRAVQRQVRFLYDLALSREHLATFELRLVSWPQISGLTRVGIVFFAKTFHPNEQMSRKLALQLWYKFNAIFPHEVPFSYPLVPVREFPLAGSLQTHSFQEWYEPISLADLTSFESIVEIRKYEDWPTLRNLGGVFHAHDYIPHPFVPALDYSAMARLFETLAHQATTRVVAITIRPQQLTDQEELILYEHAGWFERVASGTALENNPLADVMHELKNDVFDAYPRSHAEQGKQVYEVLKRECRTLFLIRLQVLGEPAARSELVEALGSEVMANAGNAYPSRWSRVVAANDKEFHWAHFNWQWLEFARWGISSRIQQAPALIRLRQLATVLEVSGAFRLPVAPGSGGLLGLDVRDEPFPVPTLPVYSDLIHLGVILDRGIPTGVPYPIPIDIFAGFTQMYGQKDIAQENVLYSIARAMSARNIPWALIRGSGASPTGLSSQLQARTIRLNTDPLPFQPLIPPPGIALARFIDALARVCMSACHLDEACGSLLRRAFTQGYEHAGWGKQQRGHTVDPAVLAASIETLLREERVPTKISDLLQARCVTELQDMSAISAGLWQTSHPGAFTWSEPLIIESGWLGDETQSRLARGWLWAWLAFSLTQAPDSPCACRSLVIVEDAHTLFGTSNEDALSPLTALAQDMTRFGTGTMCVDHRPDSIDAAVNASAQLTILTMNSNSEANDHIAQLLGISQRQRTRIHHLQPMEAVIAARGVAPTLIRLDFLERLDEV